MSVKKLILQLEKFFKQNFHDLDAGFYVSKGNMCVSIFSYSNYKEIIEEYNKFFEEHLSNKFIVTKLQLIHTAKWKFNYIISWKNKK